MLFSVRFRLRGVAHLPLRLNNTGVRYGFFPFSQCFLSFDQCLLACIRLRFPLRKLSFSGRILLVAGANLSRKG